MRREAPHPDPLARVAEPLPLKPGVTEVERRRYALLTMAGRALYAKRKCTVEPVIGIVKSVMRFRAILVARIGTRQRRVESGCYGVEFKADVCLGGVAQSRNGLMADGNHP